MIALIQRVLESNVTVNAELIDSMRGGLLIFLGINSDDTENDARYLAAKTANLRIFSDSEDKMNLSLLDNSLDAMVISQFTLHADTRHGNRPSFTEAAEPDRANELYMMFIEEMKMLIGNDKVHRGEFGAMMKVKLVNDGPVTIILRSKNDY
ncbi:MAG: D-tyrosyl-tRNA(Tyr) deacylase [Ignavibacteria bacterium]|nr:D-tyrosyl-tRNA(Tyr) deacylase [Ignavibacteria bacterium]